MALFSWPTKLQRAREQARREGVQEGMREGRREGRREVLDELLTSIPDEKVKRLVNELLDQERNGA